MRYFSINHVFPSILFVLLGLAEPAGAEPATFVQLCDTQLGMGGYEDDKARFQAAVAEINALEVDWVFICGDLVNNGKDDQAVADFRAILEGFAMPCYLAPGNHDVENEPTPATLKRYRELQGEDYYAIDRAGWKLVIVNTQLWKAPVPGESETHDTWFLDTLKGAHGSDTPVLIVSHYPPFLKAPEEEEGYYNLPPETRKRVVAAAERYGARAWLAGHVHKNLETAYKEMAIVASATTSKNFDGAPYGFRVWTITENDVLEHKYVALELPESLSKPAG